jgi:hypothetical protein
LGSQRRPRVQDLAPNTLDAYAQQYRKHIKPRWGHVQLKQISGIEIQRFEADLRSKLAASSVTIILTVLSDMLADAVFNDLIGTSPMPPKRQRRRKRSQHQLRPRRPGLVTSLENLEAI